MAEPVAGESSPQQETSKAPWEAGFWGQVGETLTSLKESLVGASTAPAEPSKSKGVMPWDTEYWKGRKIPKPKVPPSDVKFKTDAEMQAALVIQPNEVMPDTQSVESNLTEIEKEIQNAKDPKIKAVLMQERAKLERLQPQKLSPGMLEPGNIDLNNRPIVKNKDGTVSTVRSIGVNIDNQEVLIPTVSEDGRIMSDQEAIQQYRQTGRHLGKFKTVEASNAYAVRLHKDQEKLYGKKR